jgi:hypothetical protein
VDRTVSHMGVSWKKPIRFADVNRFALHPREPT